MKTLRHNEQCPTCLKYERQAASATHRFAYTSTGSVLSARFVTVKFSIQYHNLVNNYYIVIRIIKSLKIIQAQCKCQFFMIKIESRHSEFNNVLKELKEAASTVDGDSEFHTFNTL